jgi:hypothetical protein
MYIQVGTLLHNLPFTHQAPCRRFALNFPLEPEPGKYKQHSAAWLATTPVFLAFRVYPVHILISVLGIGNWIVPFV